MDLNTELEIFSWFVAYVRKVPQDATAMAVAPRTIGHLLCVARKARKRLVLMGSNIPCVLVVRGGKVAGNIVLVEMGLQTLLL